MKQIILLGASGSIGEQTLDVIRSHPELFELVAFSVRSRLAAAYKILDEFKVRAICVKDERDADEIRKNIRIWIFISVIKAFLNWRRCLMVIP